MYNNEPELSSTGKSNYLEKYFEYSEALVSTYTGKEPFHIYIKKYFSLNKKHGSRDRKIITSLCYSYFRLGDGVSNDLSFGEKLLLSIFLCESRNAFLIEFLKSQWKAAINLPLIERLKIAESRNLWTRKKIKMPFGDFYKWYLSHERKCFYCDITEQEIKELLDSGRLTTKRIATRGRKLELDRKQPDLEYDNFDNIVFACYWCNNAKTDTFTEEEFKKIGQVFKEIWKIRLGK